MKGSVVVAQMTRLDNDPASSLARPSAPAPAKGAAPAATHYDPSNNPYAAFFELPAVKAAMPRPQTERPLSAGAGTSHAAAAEVTPIRICSEAEPSSVPDGAAKARGPSNFKGVDHHSEVAHLVGHDAEEPDDVADTGEDGSASEPSSHSDWGFEGAGEKDKEQASGVGPAEAPAGTGVGVSHDLSLSQMDAAAWSELPHEVQQQLLSGTYGKQILPPAAGSATGKKQVMLPAHYMHFF